MSLSMNDSRIAGFFKLDVASRIDRLRDMGWLSAADADALKNGHHLLAVADADRTIENVVGVFALPFAIAPNFRVNDRDYLVPMVVEEPSIVAALSNSAALARPSGGFEASCEEPLLAGQVHVTGATGDAAASITAASEELLAMANGVHPRLVARGGGARRIDVRELTLPNGDALLAIHVLVDTRDAMGANIVNTICEAIAPRIAELSGGTIALRILSNLCDEALVTARVRYPAAALVTAGFSGEQVRDGIVAANDIALCDAYRAATHNKGIMNGIDPLAIATGNDWRAIEAGAHAYAAQSGSYRALTSWTQGDNGDLVGEIRIPLKVATVGGTLAANPAAELALGLTGVETAKELAGLMAAVGLAQNFGALRALATAGIQKGHMKLHARSVAAAADPPDELFEALVDRLVASGDINAANATRLLGELSSNSKGPGDLPGRAAGKVILLGEHAVVYGKHALAVPIPDAVCAAVETTDAGLDVTIPGWNVATKIDPKGSGPVEGLVMTIIRELGLPDSGYAIHVRSALPVGMGLGSSASIAVAITRAFDEALGLGLDNERVNAIAFECEKLAHGTPSGIDNTLATFAEPMVFSNDKELDCQPLKLDEPPPLVIAWGRGVGNTRDEVAGVRARFDADRVQFGALFGQIDAISLQGANALEAGDYAQLGRLMNVCHGLLNAIGVSTPELERMVAVARKAGALGAKLTGAGGGGSIVALCPGKKQEVEGALRAAGFYTLENDDPRK